MSGRAGHWNALWIVCLWGYPAISGAEAQPSPFSPFVSADVPQTMEPAGNRVAESFAGEYRRLHFTLPDLDGPSPVEVRLVHGEGEARYPRIALLPAGGAQEQENLP